MAKKIKNDKYLNQQYINALIYDRYLTELKKIILSIFEWVNLPDTMNPMKIEQDLFMFGQCSFLKDLKYGIINTKCTDTRKN